MLRVLEFYLLHVAGGLQVYCFVALKINILLIVPRCQAEMRMYVPYLQRLVTKCYNLCLICTKILISENVKMVQKVWQTDTQSVTYSICLSCFVSSILYI